MVTFSCPHCQTKLRIAEQAVGRKAKCPACNTSITLQLPANVPLAPTPANAPAPTLSAAPPPPVRRLASAPTVTFPPPPAPVEAKIVAASDAPAKPEFPLVPQQACAPGKSKKPPSCYHFACTCKVEYRARQAYAGQEMICGCTERIIIPEHVAGLPLWKAVFFFSLPLALATLVIGLAVGIYLSTIEEYKAWSMTAFAIIAPAGLLMGVFFAWFHVRHQPQELHDWFTNGDPIMSFVYEKMSDPRSVAIPTALMQVDEAGKPKPPSEPEYSFRPGRWTQLGCGGLLLVGLFIGGVLGFLGGLAITNDQGVKEDYSPLKDAILGMFLFGFGLAFVGWVLGMVLGTLCDMVLPKKRKVMPR
jgi:predicted Zn finger-like uncharacterized protein